MRRLKKLLKKIQRHVVSQPPLDIFANGTLPGTLNTTQQMFIQWNAERLNISAEESRERYFNSWKAIRNGHQGAEYRVYNELSYRLFQVFFDDNEIEIFNAYQLHAPMHFLRMLSYSEPKWNDNDLIVRNLSRRSKITILDFGCGLAQRSRTLAEHLVRKGKEVHLVLADIPTIRKKFLLWLGEKTGIATTFLDCTADAPIPELPTCDICFAIEFFEHIHNPVHYLDRIHRALSFDGLLITNVSDHKKEFMHVSPVLDSVRNQIRVLGYKELLPNEIYCKREAVRREART